MYLLDIQTKAKIIVLSSELSNSRTMSMWKYSLYMPTRESQNYIVKWAHIHTTFKGKKDSPLNTELWLKENVIPKMSMNLRSMH